MTGKDLDSLNQENQETIAEFNIIEEDKQVILEGTTHQGDQVKMIFSSSVRRLQHAQIAKALWEEKGTYHFIDDTIMFQPTIYWKYYKRVEWGKEVLTQVKSLLFINGQEKRFAATGAYFKTKNELYGIYGIYYKNELWYVGSSSDMIHRWQQHNQNFKWRSSSKPMYEQRIDPAEVEYRVIFSGEDLSKWIGVEQISMWLVEFAEMITIKLLQPKFNLDGAEDALSFTFQAKQGDIPVDYWAMVKEYLEKERIDIRRLDMLKKMIGQ